MPCERIVWLFCVVLFHLTDLITVKWNWNLFPQPSSVEVITTQPKTDDLTTISEVSFEEGCCRTLGNWCQYFWDADSCFGDNGCCNKAWCKKNCCYDGCLHDLCCERECCSDLGKCSVECLGEYLLHCLCSICCAFFDED